MKKRSTKSKLVVQRYFQIVNRKRQILDLFENNLMHELNSFMIEIYNNFYYILWE